MRILSISFALFAASCGAPQQPATTSEVAGPAIAVSDAWATVTPGGVNVSAGYAVIANTGETDTLTGASSPRATSVELHTMTLNGDVMEMRQVATLDVPAGGAASFAPGGNHLMFIGVTQPFAEGETIPVTLTFTHAGAVEVNLLVRPASGVGPSGH